jgi:hypothetical protein
LRSDFLLIKRPGKNENKREYYRFHNFLYEGQRRPDIIIDVHIAERLPKLKAYTNTFITTHFADNQENWRMMRMGRVSVFRCPMQDEEKLAFIEKGSSRAKIHLLPKPKKGKVWQLSDIADNFLHILLINYLAEHNLGIFAHAAGIRNSNGEGFLFCGKSAAGKSTTARIWFSHTKAGVLNDDRMIVRRQAGSFFLYSSPWTGEFYRNLKTKLLPARCNKVFFLYHEKQNTLSRVKAAQAFGLLYPTIFPAFWDKHRLENTARFCHDLIRQVPCYSLGFVNDKKVIPFVRNINR